jgi:hypothetical protein
VFAVVHNEGLRSSKAIAFIESLTMNCYLELGAPLQKAILSKQTKPRQLSENLGEKIWTK